MLCRPMSSRPAGISWEVKCLAELFLQVMDFTLLLAVALVSTVGVTFKILFMTSSTMSSLKITRRKWEC